MSGPRSAAAETDRWLWRGAALFVLTAAALGCQGCAALDDARTALVAYRYVGGGTDLLLAGDRTRALEHFDRARDLRPSDPKVLRLLALRYALLWQVEEAARCLVAAAENDDDLRAAAEALRELPEDKGRRAEIIVQALTPTPQQPQLLIECARQAGGAGQMDVAITLMEKAVEADPDDPMVLNNVGFTLADWDVELDRALYLTKKADAIAPNEGAIVDSVGWAYFRKGMLREARPRLEAAVRMAPKSGEVRYHLGMLYSELGLHAEAQQQLALALEYDAGLTAAQRELQRLRWALPPPATG